MGTLRFKGGEIGSYTPAFDARNVEDIFVVSGRNYSFDTKGPKTDFGDRYATPIPLRAAIDVHGTRIAGRTFVHTEDSLLEYDTTLSAWIAQFYFVEENADPELQPGDLFAGRRWTAAFLDRTIYFAHVTYGWIRVDTTSTDTDQIFLRMLEDDFPGLPSSPLGIIETNGRIVALTNETVSWSGPADGTDWTPALGGSGFQILSARVGGDPIALTGFSGGFIVWTTSSALLAEFIGGETVWRFSVLMTESRPQNAFCVAMLNQDESLFLTAQGLFVSKNGKVPEAYQPGFNEFLRDYLSSNPMAEGRLEFDSFRNRLYVQTRTHPFTYVRSFVLTPTISKWGEFSERNLGILPITAEWFGWVGEDRIVRRWLEAPFRETLPEPEELVNLVYPRIPKRFVDGANIWSTSGVCQNTSHSNQTREGFYATDADVPRSPSIMGLGASIELGYFHPGQIDQVADGLVEVQLITLGSFPQALPLDLVPGNPEYDIFIEHYSLMYAESEDYNDSILPDEDWDDDSGDEDWDSQYSLFNLNAYDIELRSSQDGFTYKATAPERARFDTMVTTYSCMTSGTLHTLMLSANDPGNRIQVRYLEMTLAFGGRLV